jgi:flagellar hook-associated protein 2
MSTTTSATSNAISALGAGSGMDVKALANSLVDAERAPRKDIIDKKISKSEAGISGYSAIKFVFEGLKTSLMDIKDQSDFSSITPRNSQSAAFTVTASATASAGSHTVNVTSLAKAERKLTAGLATTATPINNGEAFNLNLTIHGGANQPISVAAGKDTPSGIVAAINEANLGVKAQLVNTGEAGAPYKIMVTGQTGALNDFELSAEPVAPATTLSAETSVLFNTRLQSAANGVVSVDGMNLTPSSNQLTDLIPGVTLDLYATTTGDASVDLIRDTSSVKTKVAALVKAYNDANTMLNTVSDAKSSVETYGGSLAGNSVVNSLRTQMRELIFPSTGAVSNELVSLRDIGLSLDKDGTMTLDNVKLDQVLSTRFDEAVTMLTGNSENLSAYSSAPSGAVGAAFKGISAMLSSTGTVSQQSTNLTKRITEYKDELAKLETRMTQLLERYNQQFGAMESIVGQSKSLRTSLSSTFEGMMASYTKG